MDKRVLNDLKESYGFEARSFSRVNGGYKNELWRVETGDKQLLMKVFSPERFPARKLEQIERALACQQRVRAFGVPCPQVYLHAGKALRRAADATYMVMDYCEGRNETPETITPAQIQNLGEALGKLHAALAQLTDAAPGYARAPEKLLEGICALSKKRKDIAEIARAWSREKLMSIPTGLAHEDMTADNVLFSEKGVAAIIDFDRCCHGYPLHDVGRAILSFALTDEGFEREKVRAFVQGYRHFLPLDNIVQALELTWLIEAPWWMSGDEKELTGKARRFRQELLYLTEHYNVLSVLGKMD